MLTERTLSDITHRRLELALAETKNWEALDPRTKELHRSTLQNALRPLLSPAAHNFFAPKPTEFRAQEVLNGKILVVSLDAISNPSLARLLFRVVRQDFYTAVQSRLVAHPNDVRLCGLIADELPLSVMPEDTAALCVIRAKGGFVVAAAQSFSGLDEVLGARGRAALMANFNNVFFFSARENVLEEYALVTLGTRERQNEETGDGTGTLFVTDDTGRRVREPVCPLGSLGRLKPHEALAKLADGTCTERPVWLQPSFFDASPKPNLPALDDLSKAVSALQERRKTNLAINSNLASFTPQQRR